MVRPAAVAVLLIAGFIPVSAIAAQAYDPDAPTPSLTYTPLPEPARLPALGELDWRGANDTVGAFPRGHIDILKWEAENSPAPPADASTDAGALTPRDAVRQALTHRPELFASSDMSAIERARADIAMVEFARDVHRAWISAVAARQGLGYAQRAFDTQTTASALAVRMTQVGNWGQDRLLREQFTVQAVAVDLARARQQALSRNEALYRELGAWDEAGAISLPAQLPDLPATPISADGLEAHALRNHPQLKLAAITAERAQRGLGAQSMTGWNEATSAAIAIALDGTGAGGNPLDQLPGTAPVLDLRRAAISHDTERAVRAQAEATRLAVTIRSRVREAYHHYRVAHERALQARNTVELRVAAQEDMVLRYNGMLKSTWDVLAAARARLVAEAAAVQAQRDFWLAHTNLQAVLGGGDYAGPDATGASGADNDDGGH